MNARAQDIAASRPRLGFLGLGWIGRQRMETLSAEEAELAFFADADEDRAASIAAAHGAPCGSRLEQMLDAQLDGVVIATPSALHEAQARAALEAGLAVFCQKPLATSAAGAARVIEAAARADRLLAADFCYREVEGMAQIRERLRARELGKIFSVDLVFHNAWSPASAWCNDVALAGGGCLLDLGVHLLDLALWLQDFPALQVEAAHAMARGAALRRHGEVEDFACATLRQSDGAVVRLACSWHWHAGQGAEIGLRIHGTRGALVWHNVDGSFHDFETWSLRGDHRERLAQDAGRWPARALKSWVTQLARDRRFSPEAQGLLPAARAIDAIYRHAGREVAA